MKRKIALSKNKKVKEEDMTIDKNSQEFIDQKEMEELEKNDHEPFDEYLEMIITFGYITLFASKFFTYLTLPLAAFPLASTISVVFLYLESRADIFKLEKLAKKPMAHKTSSIGSWQYVLEFIAFLSIFTNIILFTYASEQIDALIPSLKKYTHDSTYSVLAVFTIEHFLIVVAILLRTIFDTNPHWVKIFYERRNYHKH